VEKKMVLFSRKSAVQLTLACILGLFMVPVFAHVSASHVATGFNAGFMHPLMGLDHLLAMLAVGLWAAQNKHSACWVLPIVFPSMMAVGAVMAFIGFPLSGIELGIAGSVALLGLFISFAVNMPVWAGSLLISLFAIAHGYAHGVELPQDASALQYGAGFIAATAMLHLFGLIMGLVVRGRKAEKGVRFVGSGIAVAGVYLLAGLI
jgi:urease accessory protein